LTIPQDISPIPEKSLTIMEQFSRRAQKSLGGHDLDVIRIPELIHNAEIAEEEIDYLINENIHCFIIMIGAWPSPALAIDMVDRLSRRAPVVLWAFPEDTILSLVPTCQFHGAEGFIVSCEADTTYAFKCRSWLRGCFCHRYRK
jgi:hypothetical protein